MTVKEAIEYIISKSKEDESLLIDTKRFWAFLLDLASDHRKELNVIKRSLDSEFLTLCFKDKEDIKRRVFKMKYRLEDQGVGENWIDFIIDSFFAPLGWEPPKDEEEISQTQNLQTQNKQTQKQQTQKQQTQKQQTQKQQTQKQQTQNQQTQNQQTQKQQTQKQQTQKQQTQKQQTQKQQTQKQKQQNGAKWGLISVLILVVLFILSIILSNSNKNTIEVALDEQVLKQLGYDVEYKEKGTSSQHLVSLKKNGQNIKDLNIPSTYNYNGKNYKITKIYIATFKGDTSLEKVIIPESVKSIGEGSFYDCTSLNSVSLPKKLTNIGRAAFGTCSSLTSITIPNSVTNIGECAFLSCSSLRRVDISNTLTKIGKGIFLGCSSLISVVIPNSVIETIKYFL